MQDPINLLVSKPASPNYVSAVLDLLTPLVATWLQLVFKYSPLPSMHISDKKKRIEITFKITNSSQPLYCPSWFPLLVLQLLSA